MPCRAAGWLDRQLCGWGRGGRPDPQHLCFCGAGTPVTAAFGYLRDITERTVEWTRTRRVTECFHHTDATQANNLTNTDDSKTQEKNRDDEV